MEREDNIELRSEKVRNIIGQIPPRVIRWGITVIFFVVLGLLIGSYFFRYDYIIKTTATLYSHNDTTFVSVKIPANEIARVKTEQQVILNLDNIKNLYNKQIITSLQTVPHKLIIKDDEGYYQAIIKMPHSLTTTEGESVEISDTTTVKAEIITGKVSFFDRVINRIK